MRLFGLTPQRFSTSPAASRVLVAIVACAVAGAASWLVVSATARPNLDYRLGDIVRSEIIAPRSLSVPDPERTAEMHRRAEETVLPVFDYTPEKNARAVEAITSSLRSLGTRYEEEAAANVEVPLDPGEFVTRHGQEFPFGGSETLAILARQKFNSALVDQIVRSLSRRTSGYIIGDDVAASPQLLVRDVRGGGTYPLLFRDVVRLSDAKSALREDFDRIGSLSPQERGELAKTFDSVVAPTLLPNVALTEQAQQAARENVREAADEYHANDIIAYRGQPVDARIARALATLRLQTQAMSLAPRWGALAAFIGVLLYALWRLSDTSTRTKLSRTRVFLFVALMLLIQIAIVRLGATGADRLGTLPLRGVGATQFLFAIPFALGPLVIALLVSRALALALALVILPLIALMTQGQYGGGIAIGMYAALGSIAVLWTTARYRARLIVLRAGLVLLAANVLAIGIITLMAAPTFPPPSVLLANFGAAAFSALLSAGLAALVLPAAEWVFDIPSDVRLLELANADHRLLRELAVRAPGTHQHSYIMSSVATEAAAAIGANPLLVRVGAYYHDIGKLHAPHLFVENQGGGPNPHDEMDPFESARQIMRHVSYGVELAREEGLPEQVIEMITGHHGTRPVHFFLEKAKKNARPGVPIDEQFFYYPGPKPQTRESAILMLADGSEAAVRSLDEPEREQVEAIIRRISDAVLADDQLDECGITLAEVARVREAIVDALMHIHHRRVKYPGFNPAPVLAVEQADGRAPAGDAAMDSAGKQFSKRTE